MCDVRELFDKCPDFPDLECLEIFVFPARDTVLVIVITLIDYVFRTELVPDFLFKLVEDIR